MTFTRRSKTLTAVLALVAGLSVTSGTSAGAADPDSSAPPANTKPLPEPDVRSVQACCYTHVRSPIVSLPPGAFASALATCPPGHFVLGGGGSNSVWGGSVVMTDSLPIGTMANPPGAWRVYMKNNGTSEATFTAYAVCGFFQPV